MASPRRRLVRRCNRDRGVGVRHAVVVGRLRARAGGPFRAPARRHATRDGGQRHRQHLDRRAGGPRSRGGSPGRGAPRPLLARARHQPPGDRGGLRPAPRAHGRLSRRARRARRCRYRPPGASSRPSGRACSNWPRRVRRVRTPTSSPSSTPPGRARSSAPARSSPRRSPSSSKPTRPRPALSPARYAGIYLPTQNYSRNLRRLGYGDADIEEGGSDRLIDAVIPWGDAATVASRVQEHLDAGADHVCIQVVADHGEFPLSGYRELAAALAL